MAFKLIPFLALLAVTAAAPQHYHQQPQYYQHEPSSDESSSSAVQYKKISEHSNPVQYEYTYTTDDSHHNSKNSMDSGKSDGKIIKEHYEVPAVNEGYKHYIEYTADVDDADKMKQYDPALVHYHNGGQNYVAPKESSEQKYFISSPSYKNEDYSKQQYVSAAASAASAHQSSGPVYHEKQSIPSIVYQHEPEMNQHKHEYAAASHHSDSHSQYDGSAHYEPHQMKSHESPVKYDYSGSSVVASEKHTSHTPSAIYYQEIPVSHHDSNGGHSSTEAKYVLVKAENPVEHESDSKQVVYEHESKPKWSDASTSSHVSFNGPNASYHY